MFDEVLVVFVPGGTAAAGFRQLAVPICRAHGHDDVLPDVPDLEAVQARQYTLLRPPQGASDGDAADGFAGSLQHDGLVVVSDRRATHKKLVVPCPDSAPGRFPWHPWCLHFTPRGCSVSAAVLQEAAARRQHKQQQQQLRQCSQKQRHLQNQHSVGQAQEQQQQQQRFEPVELFPVALHMEPAFLQDLAAAIVQHNRNILQEQQQQLIQQQLVQQQQDQQQQGSILEDHARRQQLLHQGSSAQKNQQQQQQQQLPRVVLMPLLLQTVQAVAAAAAIQSCWRSHRSRLAERVAERALLNRAVRVIQRAWRAFLLRQRLRLLSATAAAWRSGQAMRFSSIMCVDVGSRQLLETAVQRGREGQGLFPEHRLRFVIDNEGAVMLVDMTGSSRSDSKPHDVSAAAGGSAVAEHPSETSTADSSGNNCNSPSTTSSSSSDSPVVRVGLPKWLGIDLPIISASAAAAILDDQVWFEPFGRPDAAKLLEIGCEVKDLLAPSLIAAPGLCHPTNVAQLVTFKSKQQAGARAALLAALTYDVRAQAGCKLLSIQDSPIGAAYRSLTGGSIITNGSSTAGAVGTGSGAAAGGTGDNRMSLLSSVDGSVHQAGAAARRGSIGISSSGASTARSGASTSAEAAAVAAAAAAAAAVAALGELAMPPEVPLHMQMLPLVPIVPTSTLAAAAATSAASAEQTAAAVRADGAAVPASAGVGGVQFQTHVFYKLPHLQKLQAAAEAEAAARQAASAADGDKAAAAKPTKGGSGGTLGQSSTATATQAAAAAGTAGTCHSPGCEGAGATQLAANTAEYYNKLKLEQAEALRAKLAAEAAAAAAAAAADLAAKQQAVAAARAAAAAEIVTAGTLDPCNTAGQATVPCQAPLRTTNCSNNTSPGYWPDSQAAAAVASQALKQQLKAAAAEAADAVRQKEQEGREAVQRQQAESRASAQLQAQLNSQALQQQVLQQEDEQQEAATSRVALLRAVRGAGAAAVHRKQQLAGAFSRQCNMFSKHLKRGEVAVVRAAQLQAAAGHTSQQRQHNSQAAALAQQQREAMNSTSKIKVAQDKDELKVQLAAAESVAEVEQAARRAAVAAQLLCEKGMASIVGPAGGVWGSASPDAVLKLPLRVALVGDVSEKGSSRDSGPAVAAGVVAEHGV